MHTSLLTQKEAFIELVIDKLGHAPVDYHEKLKHIDALRKAHENHLAAGILLIFDFKKDRTLTERNRDEWFIQLIKRSDKVSQPGDLSCPGGRLNRHTDPFFSYLTSSGLLPIVRGNARNHAAKRGPDAFRAINLILANALRESWEEIGISPFNISFLGALPSYTFSPARRTIFPVAGVIKGASPLRLNGEVEKIVDLPLRLFFDNHHYASFIIDPPLPERTFQDYPPAYPCLVFTDFDGAEEILWGATYNIIMDFLRVTFGHTEPDLMGRRTVSRALRPDYMRYLKR